MFELNSRVASCFGGSGVLCASLLGWTLSGCSGSGTEKAVIAMATGQSVPRAEGSSPAGAGSPPQGEGVVVAPAQQAPAAVAPNPPNAEGMPAPMLGASPAPMTDSSGMPVTGAPPPVSTPVGPPVSDTASPLPIARQGGYTTDPNLIYGPLPQQRLDVLYPPGAGPNGTQKLPGVIMFHGGGWVRGDKATMSSFYSRFLAHGFIVATVEYRVAPQGIAPAGVQDALLAAKWFWDHLDYYNVDRSKFIVTGASAGSHLALMVGMATPEAGLGPTQPSDFQIAAIVNGYGPTDVTDMLQRNIDFALEWLPVGTPNRDAIARQVSPVSYVRQGLPPLLTVQGANDTTVPVAEGETLHQLLLGVGADAEHHLVAGAGHGFTTPDSAWPDAEATIFGFLVRHGIGN